MNQNEKMATEYYKELKNLSNEDVIMRSLAFLIEKNNSGSYLERALMARLND